MYDEIDGTCPSCGLKNVWFCSDRNCPKGKDQKAVRDRWLDRQNNPPEEKKPDVAT